MTLLGSGDSDRFSFWVIVAIHRVDRHQHCNAEQHNRQHHHHRDDSHPDWNCEETRAVVVVAEATVCDAKRLKLNSTWPTSINFTALSYNMQNREKKTTKNKLDKQCSPHTRWLAAWLSS